MSRRQFIQQRTESGALGIFWVGRWANAPREWLLAHIVGGEIIPLEMGDAKPRLRQRKQTEMIARADLLWPTLRMASGVDVEAARMAHAASEMASRAASVRTERRAAASRENGKLGGRPARLPADRVDDQAVDPAKLG